MGANIEQTSSKRRLHVEQSTTKHRANIEQTSNKRGANIELARPANIKPARRASSSSQLDRVNGVLATHSMRNSSVTISSCASGNKLIKNQ